MKHTPTDNSARTGQSDAGTGLCKLLRALQWWLLILFAGMCAWHPLVGFFDFWAHAAVGSWIALNGRPPYTGLFIWSEPNFPWVAHSWLSQYLFYEVLARGGPGLVVVLHVATVVLSFALMALIWKRNATASLWGTVALALAITASLSRFQPRQETVSSLLTIVVLLFLLEWQRGRFDEAFRKRGAAMWATLLTVPLFFCLWVNLHALSLVGLILLVCAALADGWQGRGGPHATRGKWLWLLTALALLSTLANPYGLSYWQAAAPLKPGNLARYVTEWKPVWEKPALPAMYIIFEGLLFFWALGAWLRSPERRWSHALWMVFGAAITLKSRRMLWLSAIIFFVVLAVHLHPAWTQLIWKKWQSLTGRDPDTAVPTPMRVIVNAGWVMVLAGVVFVSLTVHTPGGVGNWNQWVKNAPEGASAFLEKQPGSLRIFNDYQDSSYLQWRLNGRPRGNEKVPAAGRHPLYIDLLNAYPDEMADEYLNILALNKTGLQKFKERKIDTVVLADDQWKQPLVVYLEKQKDWKLVFKDKESRIWMKRRETY